MPKRYKEDVAERQRRRITAFNCLMPLFLLVISCTGLIFGIRQQTLEASLNNYEAGLAVHPIVTREEALAFYGSDTYIAYYDESGQLIASIGNFPEGIFSTQDRIPSGTDLTLGKTKYAFRTVDITVENDYRAQTALILRTMSNDPAYVSMILMCVAIFAAFWVIQIVIATVSAVYQIKPYTREIQRNKRLIADISHEFNTPLAVIQSELSTALAQPEKTVEEISGQISISLDEANRLKRMVKDTLFLSRSDNKTMVVEKARFDLSAAVADTVEPFELMAELDGKCLKKSIQEGIVTDNDRDKFRQMLIILLDNAIKYTQVGDTIAVALTENAGRITLTVSDTGCGVSEENLSKIFERFYRTDDARSMGGTGLGLAIVKAIANNVGGKVYAEHNVPKGLKMVFEVKK